MKNIDFDLVKQNADLLAIVERDTQLRKAATTRGGEYTGACPFCGGRDRFHVQPYAKPPVWMCRQCGAGKWDTVIGYIARRDHLDPNNSSDLEEICRRAIGDIPISNTPRPEQSSEPAYDAPDKEWQASALEAIQVCRRQLWAEVGQKPFAYLKSRGLSEQTIDQFNLGYSTGATIADFYIPRGVMIPCIVAGEVWYLKIRLPAQPGEKKYTQVKGSRPKAIYHADALIGASMALFCEGEFDCMIAAQEFGQVIPTVTLGSVTNLPDLATWGPYLLSLQVVMTTYDSDKAGSVGAAALGNLVGDRAKLAPLPEGVKDINDFYKSGGDLQAWLKDYQAFYTDPFFMVA